MSNTDTDMPPPTYDSEEERIYNEALDKVHSVIIDVLEMQYHYNDGNNDVNNIVLQKRHYHFYIVKQDNDKFNFILENRDIPMHSACYWLETYKNGGEMCKKLLSFLYKFVIKCNHNILGHEGEIDGMVEDDMDIYDADRSTIFMFNKINSFDKDNNKVDLFCK